jgi:hypothetical protein
MEKSSGHQIRRGEHLKTVRAALVDWRFKTHQRRYTPSPYTAVVILPDATLTTLASNARIKTIDDMNEILNPSWVFASRHGQEVLDLLAKLDESEKDDREHEKLRKCEERKKETAERREAERLQKRVKMSQSKQIPCSPQGILVNSSMYNVPIATPQVSFCSFTF